MDEASEIVGLRAEVKKLKAAIDEALGVLGNIGFDSPITEGRVASRKHKPLTDQESAVKEILEAVVPLKG